MKFSEELIKKKGKNFKAGEIIFEENDPANEMYILISGSVGIHKRINDAYKLLIELKAGDMFGEMALIDNKPRSARAVAISSSLLFPVTENLLQQLIQTNSEFTLRLVKILSNRLREANYQITALLKGDRKNIVKSNLATFANIHGKPLNNGYVVGLQPFLKWAILRAGLDLKDIQEAINQLIRDRMVNRLPNDPGKLFVLDSLGKYDMEAS
ncbi:Crp/Fnr family transcriptional regulator [Leptospira sp. GIMC2001]|uniref:Crp/Fnr family transcriptional regulator n=1 Tax=Leptospira sp. GIMC2001 TaxID=1513297 RepID=UPI00234BDAD2|nr:cyclic nucleotide-binding domain-containing protein [Leptospira sp. GIMC2001]WCL48562.1 cyclic nucleotide-binding domain-containing protein [Leptospira sp. GIMC2001]